MDKAPLVAFRPDLDVGRELIQALDNPGGLPVTAAFWMLDPELREWRLLVASPTVEIDGPRAAYRALVAALNSLPHSGLSIDEISLVGPSDPTVSAVHESITTTSELLPVVAVHLPGDQPAPVYVYRSLPRWDVTAVVIAPKPNPAVFRLTSPRMTRLRKLLPRMIAAATKRGGSLGVTCMIDAATEDEARQIVEAAIAQVFSPDDGYTISVTAKLHSVETTARAGA